MNGNLAFTTGRCSGGYEAHIGQPERLGRQKRKASASVCRKRKEALEREA